jgi:hypothetical protein
MRTSLARAACILLAVILVAQFAVAAMELFAEGLDRMRPS